MAILLAAPLAGFDLRPTRRQALLGMAAASVPAVSSVWAAEAPLITVHKDPNCGCCTGWVQHLQKAGFIVKAVDTDKLSAVKARLGVPDDLAACHTAEAAGYVIEGHVPAVAVRRLPQTAMNGSALPATR